MGKRRAIPYLEEVRHSPHICLAEGVRSANRAVSRWYADYLEDSPLSVAQASLLMRLYYLREPTIMKLAQHLEADRTTLSRNVDLLQKGGFVEIVPGEDRRSRIVRMTDAGWAALEEVLPKWRAAQDALRERLGDADWVRLLADTRLLAGIFVEPPGREAR